MTPEQGISSGGGDLIFPDAVGVLLLLQPENLGPRLQVANGCCSVQAPPFTD